MVDQEQLLAFMREQAYKPMTYQELEKTFEISDSDDFKNMLKLLNKMEQEGAIIRTRSNRYGVPERMNLVKGTLQAHAKGFGFLLPEEKTMPDVYIHANDLNTAMNGDTVLVRVTSKGRDGARLEGEVARIVRRANTEIVGTYEFGGSYGFVIPDDKRIARDLFIPLDASKGAEQGQKVVARIVKYPEGRSAAEGEIVEILGFKQEVGVDILSIIRKHQLPEHFPDDVLEEAEAVAEEIAPQELEGRRDLRDLPIVTIDGADAKDLDDAVHVELLPNGHYRLGVHIADVGYYVPEHSQMDQEAYRRGCSVYLVDRVIPMLPPRLSNGICSLNPQVDRLTLTCEMEFDPHGKRVSHDIYTSVINTAERMTYDHVRKMLVDEDPEIIARYQALFDDVKRMEKLALILRKNRMERGAIDFDFKESKIKVDESGKPIEIVMRERSIAEQLIEEFMLAANETVAEHFFWLKTPFLYRIHEEPDEEKLQHFTEFITNFGYVLRGRGNKVHPHALQRLLEQIKDTKEETVISTVMLRSMKQAKYDPESLGHFGLAAKFYSHFTSPIRRYPDLVIHRIIREIATSKSGMLDPLRSEQLQARMGDIAKQSSERERQAAEAERETDELKKAEFMLDKVGQAFTGIISGVTSFGMFIELENTVEGLVRLSDLTDDYYHHHERQMALIGERTSKIYRIGDEVEVRVKQINMDDFKVDFELVGMKKTKGRHLLDRMVAPAGRGASGRGGRRVGGGGERPGSPGKEKRDANSKAAERRIATKTRAVLDLDAIAPIKPVEEQANNDGDNGRSPAFGGVASEGIVFARKSSKAGKKGSGGSGFADKGGFYLGVPKGKGKGKAKAAGKSSAKGAGKKGKKKK